MTRIRLSDTQIDARPRRNSAIGVRGLVDVIAGRVLSGRFLGVLRPGDRLPSVRAVAAEFGADHRTVSAAYRELERIGVVEIRGRAGAFVSAAAGTHDEATVDEPAWIADIVAGAWGRGLDLQRLVALLHRGYDGSGFTAAFVESNTDQLTGGCADLRAGFGLRVVPVRIAPTDVEAVTATASARRLRADLAEVDLVFTTADHHGFVHPIASALGKPVVLLALDPVGLERAYQLLSDGALTLLVADPSFEARLRASFQRSGVEIPAGAIVQAGDAAALATLNRRGTLLATRAAAAMLARTQLNCLVPHHRVLSTRTVREVVTLLCELKSRAAGATPRET